MSGWVAETLAASTVLMLMVLALRTSVAQAFGARIAYALWLIPALRMILPPLPEQVAVPLPAIRQAVMPTLTMPVEMVAAAPSPVDLVLVLLGIWFAGTLVHFTGSLVRYARFVRDVRTDAEIVVGIADGVPVWTSRRVDGPLAIGVFDRAIILPHDYATRYSAAELALALRHEAAHHARQDLAANLVALALRSAHWFNPVAAWAYHAFRADQELACDAAVIEGNSADRHAYGCALVKSASNRMPAAACALNGKNQLKRRLVMMSRKASSRTRVILGGTAVALLMGAGLGLTASGSVAAEKARIASRAAVRSVRPIVPLTPVAPVAPPQKAFESGARFAQNDAETPPLPPQAPEAPPVSPVPAIAPVPPVPPAADIPDRAEIDADIREAIDDAMQSVAEARAEVAQCKRNGTCDGVDMKEIRAAALEGMEEARKEIAAERDMPAHARAQALASIEAAIARIRSDPRWGQ